MNVDLNKAASRVLGVANSLVGRKLNEESVYSKSVVLTGEPSILNSINGHWCFVDSLTILARVVGSLTVILPAGLNKLEQEVRDICDRAWSRQKIRLIVADGKSTIEAANAILLVGTNPIPNSPCTVINSNGWVARVSSGAEPLPDDVSQINPMGALMAASLGVTEIFKRIFEVPDEKAPLFGKVLFSLFDQSTNPTNLGPELPTEIKVPDTLLIGAGAIGNGIALILSRLPLKGRVHIIDKQAYGDENLGTCVLLEARGWLGQPKAMRLAQWLQSKCGLNATGEKAFIEDVNISEITPGFAVDLILNGLDDIDARRYSQSLWPSVIIDGGINEFGAAVTQYRLEQPNHACLRCWFEPPKSDKGTELREIIGLDINASTDMGRTITDEDIAAAPPEKRAQLIEHKKQGKTLCSIVSEAALASRLGVNVEDGFRPSAPFIATASASLVLAEAVKSLAFPTEPVTSMFQIANLFLGPDLTSIKLDKDPIPGCQCVEQMALILRLAERRRQRNSGSA